MHLKETARHADRGGGGDGGIERVQSRQGGGADLRTCLAVDDSAQLLDPVRALARRGWGEHVLAEQVGALLCADVPLHEAGDGGRP